MNFYRKVLDAIPVPTMNIAAQRLRLPTPFCTDSLPPQLRVKYRFTPLWRRNLWLAPPSAGPAIAQSYKESSLAMSIPATQLRPGMIIKHNNDLHSVFSVEHRTPGNLRAFIQAKLRNLRTGAMFEHRFRSPDPIEKINVDEVEMEYLYNDGDSYYFMDTSNYEQTHLTRDVLGDAVDYLIPNLQIKVEFFDGKAVGIELPQTVILTVLETEPGLKSATASSVTKPAKTETGLVVQVPPFINEGEKIKVDTSEGAYLSRA